MSQETVDGIQKGRVHRQKCLWEGLWKCGKLGVSCLPLRDSICLATSSAPLEAKFLNLGNFHDSLDCSGSSPAEPQPIEKVLVKSQMQEHFQPTGVEMSCSDLKKYIPRITSSVRISIVSASKLVRLESASEHIRRRFMNTSGSQRFLASRDQSSWTRTTVIPDKTFGHMLFMSEK